MMDWTDNLLMWYLGNVCIQLSWYCSRQRCWVNLSKAKYLQRSIWETETSKSKKVMISSFLVWETTSLSLHRSYKSYNLARVTESKKFSNKCLNARRLRLKVLFRMSNKVETKVTANIPNTQLLFQEDYIFQEAHRGD